MPLQHGLSLISEPARMRALTFDNQLSPILADNVPRLYEVFAERSGAKSGVERNGTI